MSFEKRSRPSPTRLGVSELSSGLTSEVVVSFYEALACPRSLTACLLFKYGEHDQLVSLECDPSHYENGEMFRDAYLATSFLTRSKFLKTSYRREELALLKFQKFEQQCGEVNSRLRPELFSGKIYSASDFSGVESPGNAALLSRMRRKIGRILGAFDPLELYDLSSWGPGVSTQIKGEETFQAKKFQFETGVTRDLHPLVVGTFPAAYPAWWRLLESNKKFPSFEVGNAIITVPKTSKIDRVIAIEPGLNLWFQLGLGRMIRRRLGRVGIDLTKQETNQEAARKGSISGSTVTVDFSSASDSIAYELVNNLFGETPETRRWFEVMDLIRSKYGVLGGKTFRWNKFSSMGNGFTFDLETLIFYVAAVVACENCDCSIADVSVYGDDVIIPTVAYECFCSLSTYLGFTVNKQKSFSTGNFRESCGAHYFAGRDCKPLFLEEELALPSRVFSFANLLRIRSKLPYGCEARFRRLFYQLVGALPKEIRFRVSAVVNRKSGQIEPLEGGFISNLDETSPPKARHGVEGYNVKRLAWVSVMTEPDYDGLLLAKVISVATPLTDNPLLDFGKQVKTDYNKVPLRSRTKCILKHTLVRRWCDLGPWV